jgi:cytochrome c551/c552
MLKSAVFCLIAVLWLAVGVAIPSADSGQLSGEALFRSLHCNGCHKVEGKGVGMDLKKIARGYEAKAQRLNNYLAGKVEALLNPAKARVMANQIKKTKKLSPAERQALAGYLLSFK